MQNFFQGYHPIHNKSALNESVLEFTGHFGDALSHPIIKHLSNDFVTNIQKGNRYEFFYFMRIIHLRQQSHNPKIKSLNGHGTRMEILGKVPKIQLNNLSKVVKEFGWEAIRTRSTVVLQREDYFLDFL